MDRIDPLQNIEEATRAILLQAEEAQRELNKQAEEASKELEKQISPYWDNWGKETQ
jgi:DNA-directed RNA polymerase subunit L